MAVGRRKPRWSSRQSPNRPAAPRALSGFAGDDDPAEVPDVPQAASPHNLIGSQLRNRTRAESEVAENFVGMLTQAGRVPPHLRLGARELCRRSYGAHSPRLRMLVLEERLINRELRISPNRIEIIERT